MATNTNLGPRFLPPESESNERIAAMIDWLKEINGGALPQRNSPAPAIDTLDALVAQLSGTSLDDIKATMSAEVQSKVSASDMTEDALKSLILSAAKMTISADTSSAGDETMANDPAQSSASAGRTRAHISGDWRGWAAEEEGQRCWTSGTPTCTCGASVRDYGTGWDGVDIACDLDRPVGRSVAEMRGQWTEYSPCCGELDCICTEGTGQNPWICGACGQMNCTCSE